MGRDHIHIGIDETTLGVGNGSFICAFAETDKHYLAKSNGFDLKKAKDYLKEARNIEKGKVKDYSKIPTLPPLEDMEGLTNFYWARSRRGTFKRQMVQHAVIAHMVMKRYESPEERENIRLYIDTFHGNEEMSRELIHQYMRMSGYAMPKENIKFYGKGDKSVPIINYADQLAFQIGLYLNNKYLEHNPKGLDFPIRGHEIPFDSKRIFEPLGKKGRQRLEEIADYWNLK
ncbi:MAG: hypothetical protein ACLFTH_00940 [Candidatus Woesearchaeota archaeon]